MPELIWKGKYDDAGRKVAPLRMMLPFQTVETVNESAQERQRSIFFAEDRGTDWRNRLIWGDKKYVLPSLLPELSGAIDLIYIDPPFATGADFSFQAEVPASPEDENGDDGDGDSSTFTKVPSVIEQKAYRDTWGRGLDGYAQWFYEAAILLRELLADTGSIYVHCDYRADALIRMILTEVFGAENFINEIVWKRTTAHGDAAQGARRYDVVHDTILFYCRNVRSYKWDTQYVPFS